MFSDTAEGVNEPWQVINQALAWTSHEPVSAVAKMASAKTRSGVAAAAVAAIQWQDAHAIQILTQAATAPVKDEDQYDMVTRRQIALAALSIVGGQNEAKALLHFGQGLSNDDWTQATVKSTIATALAGIDASRARKLIEASDDDWNTGGNSVSVTNLLVFGADTKNFPSEAAAETDDGWYRSDDAHQRLELLLRPQHGRGFDRFRHADDRSAPAALVIE